MPSPTLEALRQQVEATLAVEASATALILGIAQKIQDAVKAALASGATAEELAPVQAEIDSMKAATDALAAAVAANP